MESIFFLILLAIVALVQWIAKLAENKKNAEAERRAGFPQTGGGAPPTPVQRAPAQSEEERIRRFMEALGVPATSAPPPPVQPRRVEPEPKPAKRQFLPVDPFPIPQARRAEPPPVAVPTTPAIPAAPPAIPPAPPPPLPTRETTMFAEPKRQRTTRSSSASEFEVQELGAALEDAQSTDAPSKRSPAAARQPRGIAARLATAQGLRDAVVLREIFGPPRSMQPIDSGR